MSLKNVQSVSTKDYEVMIEHTIKNGTNLLVFGHPGIGKTEIPYQVCERLGFRGVYLNLSVMQPPDFLGLPRIDERGRLSYAAPAYMPVMEFTQEPVVLIVDEVDKAESELTHPLLEVLQSHTIGGNKLNIKAIIMTGNMPDDQSYSKTISHALANRCMVYQVEVSFDRWMKWATEKQLNPLVLGFLYNNQSEFMKLPKDSDPTEYSKGSPRSWSNAARQLDVLDNDSSVELKTMVLGGFVGHESATKFKVWLEHYRNLGPAIDKVLSTGECTETLTPDVQFVLGLSCMSRLLNMNKEIKMSKGDSGGLRKRFETSLINSFRYLKTLPPNFQIGILRTGLDPNVFKDHRHLASDPVVRDVYTLFAKILNDQDAA